MSGDNALDKNGDSIYSVYTMNSAVINIKTNPDTKEKAQKVAKEMGVSLSALINGFLTQVIKTKKVTFDAGEEPSDYLISMMKQADEDLKSGKASPTFDNAEDAIAWLEKQGI